MPGNTTIKEMKLIISRSGDTWNKIVQDLDGNIIIQQLGLKLFPENINKEYFDDWENQLKRIPVLNIVQVERFI